MFCITAKGTTCSLIVATTEKSRQIHNETLPSLTTSKVILFHKGIFAFEKESGLYLNYPVDLVKTFTFYDKYFFPK